MLSVRTVQSEKSISKFLTPSTPKEKKKAQSDNEEDGSLYKVTEKITFPCNVNTISNRQVMGIKKISVKGLLADLILNSPNLHHKNCMAETKENY